MKNISTTKEHFLHTRERVIIILKQILTRAMRLLENTKASPSTMGYRLTYQQGECLTGDKQQQQLQQQHVQQI